VHGDHGVKLTAIQAGGSAEASGLKAGDVIEQINFQDTKNREQFDFAVASILPGDSVPFRIERDGKESDVIVVVGAVGMSQSELRHLRVVASGHPDEADLKEARHRRDHPLPAGVGLGAIEHHDDVI
jgi:C-terminal processing protease CtpA/Prc